MIPPLLRKTAAATLAAALAAATIIVAFSSSPASTQTPLPLLSATGCTDGTFVDTSTHPVVAGANNDLVDDCQALVAIQNHWATAAINNNNVRPNRNHPLRAWGTRTQKIDTWTDITVSSSRVTVLSMERRQLEGSIPAAIGNLTNLTYISLGSNNFTGSIPAAIGNLTNLTLLSLGSTNLTGSIPTKLGNLTNLTHLTLGNNSLTGSIPAELGNLTNLTHLSLAGNKLTGSIPAELSSLAPSEGGKLTSFSICGRNRSNRFTGPIPTALRSVINSLSCVSSSSTPTPSTPPTPSAPSRLVPALSSVNCSNGTFVDTTAYPVVAGANNDLVDDCQTLVAIQNHWAAVATNNNSLPSNHPLRTWGATTQKINTWSGITITSGRVTILDLQTVPGTRGEYELYGSLPAELGNLTSLTELYLAETSLSGNIPAELGNLTNLTLLWLSHNQLSGSIPAELGNLTNLTALWLFDNRLRGRIPAELGKLSNLRVLSLDNNRLSGSIPAELGNLTSLISLRASRNGLTGSIPAELGNLTSLRHIRLENNGISSRIPLELGKLTNLKTLWLNDNRLSGSIPAELGNLTSLEHLRLENNQLTGSIPADLLALLDFPPPLGTSRSFDFCNNNLAATRCQYGVDFCSNTHLLDGTPVTSDTRPRLCYYDVTDGLDTTQADCEDDDTRSPNAVCEVPTSSTTTTTTTTTTSTVPGGDGGSSPLWNTLTIEQTGTTPAQIRQTLGLASDQAIYAWDTQTQTWQRLANPNLRIPQDTMLTFRTEQAISQENLEELNLARGTQRTTLAAGWNIVSVPETITRTSDSTGFLLADELTDCDAGTAVMAVANYSAQARAWQIWLPCNPAAQTRLTTGANPPYRPLTAIDPADTTYIYSRSAQTIAWNSDTQTYQTATS